jgi:hypothetical protein
VTRKYELCQARLAEVREDMETAMIARDAHELMRAMEAGKHSGLRRHGAPLHRFTAPKAAGASIICASTIPSATKRIGDAMCFSRSDDGAMTCEKHPIKPYIIPIADDEKDAYYNQRIKAHA